MCLKITDNAPKFTKGLLHLMKSVTNDDTEDYPENLYMHFVIFSNQI